MTLRGRPSAAGKRGQEARNPRSRVCEGRVCPEHLQDCQGQGPSLTGCRQVPGAVLRPCRCSGQDGSQGSLAGRGGHGHKALAGWGTGGEVLQTLRAPVPPLACGKAPDGSESGPLTAGTATAAGGHTAAPGVLRWGNRRTVPSPAGHSARKATRAGGRRLCCPLPLAAQRSSPSPHSLVTQSVIQQMLANAFCELEEKDAQDSASGSLRLVG